jgi:competence protein ComEA
MAPSDPAGGARSAQRLPILGGSSPFDPGRRGVKALAAVAVLVILAAGVLAWRSRPRAEPVAADLPAATAAAAPRQSAPPDGGGAEIVVAVAGKVRRPGLVRLPPGARVADAIEAAGGVLPGTDMATVNLARKVADGELIVVGVPAAAVPGGPAGGGSAGPAGPGDRVNLNTATLAQLDTLPGVGQVLAQRILDYRTSHGGFRSVSELRQVDGIGDSRFEQLKDLVTV